MPPRRSMFRAMRKTRDVAARLASTALVALGLSVVHGLRADSAENTRVSTAPEFVFARIRYDSEGSNGKAYYHYQGRIWERWETDYPEGDDNFAQRLIRQVVLLSDE